MITVLGAGGAIANHLLPLLSTQNEPSRLVSRTARLAPSAADNPKVETLQADITDPNQAIRAVADSSVVLLLLGLKYDRKVWADQWPRVMRNTIEACKRARAKLLFFDNVYMYGHVSGPMTEETPFNPCSRKGEIRAQIATTLLDEIRAGSLTAMIARAPDFYGPATPNGVNAFVLDSWTKGQKASWLVDDSTPHSLIYTPDAARATLTLAQSDIAWNQTWHLPTAFNPPTGREFIITAARAFGWVNPVVGELYEMLYQYDSAYLFDSSKYARAFGFSGTPYADGIAATAAWYRNAKRA
jgi:nucleoside-diphosphate-sugar epimerase